MSDREYTKPAFPSAASTPATPHPPRSLRALKRGPPRTDAVNSLRNRRVAALSLRQEQTAQSFQPESGRWPPYPLARQPWRFWFPDRPQRSDRATRTLHKICASVPRPFALRPSPAYHWHGPARARHRARGRAPLPAPRKCPGREDLPPPRASLSAFRPRQAYRWRLANPRLRARQFYRALEQARYGHKRKLPPRQSTAA